MSVQAQEMQNLKLPKKVISSVAMIVALISFGMLFATLMMSFFLFRFTAEVWPPAGVIRPSLILPSISTLFIFLSSLSYISFEKKMKSNLFFVSLLFGILFMASQWAFWSQLKSHGIFVSSGVFASILYAFTWIHAAHIVLGLALFIWLYINFRKNGTYSSLMVSNVGKFWHFLGIVWAIMFVTIFIF